MKSFFYIVFGGMVILLGSVGVFMLGTTVWSIIGRSDFATAVMNNSEAMFTSVNANQIQRFSAQDEEDLINSAIGILPNSDIKQMTAKAYSVTDVSTGRVVVEKNSNQLLPIASLTKLVTAIVARKLIPDTERITITKSVMSTYGNTADFTAGETFSASDLLYPMLIVSSNDAAEAYAEHYGRAKFILAMNDFVQSIGAYRTYFADSSGLDPKNVSTANDLTIILNWIRKNDPNIIAVTELKAKTIRSHTWVNPTHFLSWSYYIGGKNGYLPESNRTSASLFQWANGDVYSVVILGSSDRDADTVRLLKKIE